jgi:hypothetical protein
MTVKEVTVMMTVITVVVVVEMRRRVFLEPSAMKTKLKKEMVRTQLEIWMSWVKTSSRRQQSRR